MTTALISLAIGFIVGYTGGWILHGYNNRADQGDKYDGM